MEALGVRKETYSSFVVPVLMGKLPESVRINMIRFGKNHMDWNLDDMLEAFQKELEVLEGHFPIMQRAQQGDRRQEQHSNKPRQQDRPPTASSLLTTRDAKMKCAFCKENHASEKCEKVKDPDEPQPKPNAPQLDPTASAWVGSTGSEVNVALQTALALVNGKDRVRVLFDTGSHKSFNTAKAVGRLRLRPVRSEQLGIKAFGSKEAHVALRDVVQISLSLCNGGESVIIEAFVVKDIADIPNVHIEGLVRKLEQNPKIYEQYNDIISQQAAEGVIAKVTDLEPVGKMIGGFFVDDLVVGCEDTQEALTLYKKAKSRMSDGGFHLRKWKTNDKELAGEIAKKEINGVKEDKASKHEDTSFAKETLGMPDSMGQKTKVLGVTWDNTRDTWEFNLGNRGEELYLGKISWDDPLRKDKLERWEEWVKDLKQTGTICLPRCVVSKNKGKILSRQLHGFADASKKAYCGMAYLVEEATEGTFTRLLSAKTRVAPLKELTIPRLELMSARILATLMNTIIQAFGPQFKFDCIKYWLDSKTALYWINNNGEWKQFVQHRVNEILRSTTKEDWGHVSGIDNPADLDSRGFTASHLKESTLWWQGPHWLKEGQNSWPNVFTLEDSPDVKEERKKNAKVLMLTDMRQGVSEVVKEDNIKRGQWKVGIVKEIIFGKGGEPRGATVRKYEKGKILHLNRPLQKLYPLEIARDNKGDKSKEKVLSRQESECSVREENESRRQSSRAAAKDARWKSKLMLDP
eukprot:gene14904-biopygen4596